MLPTSSRLHNTGVFCLRSPQTGNGSPHTQATYHTVLPQSARRGAPPTRRIVPRGRLNQSMRRAAILAAALLFAAAVALPANPAPASTSPAASTTQPKGATTLWSAAKRFFVFRDHLRGKASGLQWNATRAVAMPSKFGVSYKSMVKWYCAQPEHINSHQCAQPSASKAGAQAVPTVAESKDIYKAFCALKAHKQTPVCVTSSLRKAPGVLPTASTGRV